MVKIADIQDEKSLKVWLNDLLAPSRYAVSVAIANRAAMRVLPLWYWYFDNIFETEHAPEYALALFRCTLTSTVAARAPDIDVMKVASDTRAAASTKAAAYAYAAYPDDFPNAKIAAAADAAATAATYAVDAASAASAYAAAAYAVDAAAAAADIWNLIRADCALAEAKGAPELMRRPLWSDDTPEPKELATTWTNLRKHLTDTGIDWSFWIDFAEAMRTGRGHRWKLWEAVAISPDIDWNADPEKVNAQIAKIVAGFRDERPTGRTRESLNKADKARLEMQVQFLLQTAPLQEITAAGLAAQIDAAIAEYMRSVPTNKLPPGLKTIELIGTSLRAIANKVVPARDDPSKVAELEQEVLDLEARIVQLESDLANAEYRDSFDHLFGITLESGAKWAGPTVLGGAAVFMANFVDPGTMHDLGNVLRTFLKARF